jgi:hypothetical protein
MVVGRLTPSAEVYDSMVVGCWAGACMILYIVFAGGRLFGRRLQISLYYVCWYTTLWEQNDGMFVGRRRILIVGDAFVEGDRRKAGAFARA